jgi:hypothetical protein
MTRFFNLRRVAPLPAGAFVALWAFVMLAPPGAQAGCSHLVTSRTKPARLSSVVDAMIATPDGGVSNLAEPLSVPPRPRPCTGALCSEQPAAPVHQAGVLDAPGDPWAWCVTIPGSPPASCSFIPSEMSELHPVLGGDAVFHPPRHAPHFLLEPNGRARSFAGPASSPSSP